MLDYRYAVMVNEERLHDWRRERRLQPPLRRVRKAPEHRPEGRRHWSVAGFVGRVVSSRRQRAAQATTASSGR